MELKSLRYFVKIVESGSLSRAAQALFVAQPALSHQVSALEAELDVRLFDRSPRGVSPTPAGLVLYRNAISILRQVEDIPLDVKGEAESIKGDVSIGIPTSTATVLVIPLLEAVITRFPMIRLEINENGSGLLSEWLMHGRLDLSILFIHEPAKYLKIQPLMIEDLCLVSPHSELAVPGKWPLSTVSIQELNSVSLVMPSRANGLRNVVDQALSKAGVSPKVVAELSALQSLKAAVLKGVASTILPISAVAKEWKTGRLYVRKVVKPTIARPMALCSNSTIPLSPAAEAVHAETIRVIDRLVQEGVWLDPAKSH